MVVCCVRRRWLYWEWGDVSSSKKLEQPLSFWCAVYFEEFPIHLCDPLHMPSSSVMSGLF